MDTLSPQDRSERMRRVRQKDTAPELAVRRFAHSQGLRFRLHRAELPGSPDIIFPGRRIAMFVHGCFWHGHEGCQASHLPTSNVAYWADKIAANRARDARVQAALIPLGWTPAVIWQCETRRETLLKTALGRALGSDPVDSKRTHRKHSEAAPQSPRSE